MPKPSQLGKQLEDAMMTLRHVRIDPAGHSSYLLRYRTLTGTPFAIDRTRQNGARLWVAGDERIKQKLEKEGFNCKLNVPKPRAVGSRATGRNSNLDQIPEFKDARLYWIRVTTSGETVEAVALLG